MTVHGGEGLPVLSFPPSLGSHPGKEDWTLLFESLHQLRGLLSFLLCEGNPSMPLFGCPASSQAWDRARTWMQGLGNDGGCKLVMTYRSAINTHAPNTALAAFHIPEDQPEFGLS